MTLKELKAIIEKKYLHRSEIRKYGSRTDPTKSWSIGGFTLSSGAKSDKYFDIKGMMGNNNHARELAISLIHDTPVRNDWRNPMKIGSLAGLELGGVPLVAIMQTLYDSEESNFFYPQFENVCYIRKQQRIHGLKKMIEGYPKSPILLVDDVISTGISVENAMKQCGKDGYTVCGILCVINRSNLEYFFLNPEDASNKVGANIPIYSLFKETDFQ